MVHKVLLADHSATIQKLVEIALSDSEFQLLSVSNGKQAVEQLDSFAPDIILADAHMPEMNGYEVCEHVRNHGNLAATPVIILTGRFHAFDKERADRVGASEKLVKPFSQEQLIGVMKDLLQSGSGSASAEASESGFDEGATVAISPENLRAHLQSLDASEHDEEMPSIDDFALDDDDALDDDLELVDDGDDIPAMEDVSDFDEPEVAPLAEPEPMPEALSADAADDAISFEDDDLENSLTADDFDDVELEELDDDDAVALDDASFDTLPESTDDMVHEPADEIVDLDDHSVEELDDLDDVESDDLPNLNDDFGSAEASEAVVEASEPEHQDTFAGDHGLDASGSLPDINELEFDTDDSIDELNLEDSFEDVDTAELEELPVADEASEGIQIEDPTTEPMEEIETLDDIELVDDSVDVLDEELGFEETTAVADDDEDIELTDAALEIEDEPVAMDEISFDEEPETSPEEIFPEGVTAADDNVELELDDVAAISDEVAEEPVLELEAEDDAFSDAATIQIQEPIVAPEEASLYADTIRSSEPLIDPAMLNAGNAESVDEETIRIEPQLEPEEEAYFENVSTEPVVEAEPAAEVEVAAQPDPEPEAVPVSEPVATAPAVAAAPSGPLTLSDEQMDELASRVATKVVETLGVEGIREIVWQVVPELAEAMIKKRIYQLEQSVDSE